MKSVNLRSNSQHLMQIKGLKTETFNKKSRIVFSCWAEGRRRQMWDGCRVSQLLLVARIRSSGVWCIQSFRCQGTGACWDCGGSGGAGSGVRVTRRRRLLTDRVLVNALKTLGWLLRRIQIGGDAAGARRSACAPPLPLRLLWKVLDPCPLVSWKRLDRSEWFMSARSNPPPTRSLHSGPSWSIFPLLRLIPAILVKSHY